METKTNFLTLLLTLWLASVDTASANDYRLEIHWAGSAHSGPLWLVDEEGMSTRLLCADGWDALDARVACRQLGNWTDGLAYSHFPTGDTMGIHYLTSQYRCRGNESRLIECDHEVLKLDKECKSGHHAGILCVNDTEIIFRLQGRQSQAGRVEVRVDGQWGTVCGRQWDDLDSRVMCRAHGFVDGQVAEVPEGLTPVPGPAWAPHFRCEGDEDDLHRCPHLGWIQGSGASCGGEAAVFCKRRVVLRGGRQGEEEWKGEVQVYREGRWSRVCGDNYTQTEATLACKEADPDMPYASLLKSSTFEDPHAPTTTVSVSCTGNEVTINDCVIADTTSCPSGHYASVLCSSTPVTGGGGMDLEALLLGLIPGTLALLVLGVGVFLSCRRGLCSSRYLAKMFRHRRFRQEGPSVQEGPVDVFGHMEVELSVVTTAAPVGSNVGNVVRPSAQPGVL